MPDVLPNVAPDVARAALRGRRVFVTGATGFIGSHTVRELVALGAHVHALVRPSSGDPRGVLASGAVTRWRGDITDAGAVRAAIACAQPELLLHLAADTSGRRLADEWDAIDRSVRVNVGGTLHLLRGAVESRAPVAACIRLGGLEEYGTAVTPYREEAREQPISAYSVSQVAATHHCQALQPQLPFPVVTLRPALVYGPGQSDDFFIPSLVASGLRGETFAMSDGMQHRDLLYIDDLLDAIWRTAATPGLGGEIINLGSGVEHRIRDVAEAIVRLTGGALSLGTCPARARDLVHLVTTTERAERLLGWRATTTLADGLARTVAAARAAARAA